MKDEVSGLRLIGQHGASELPSIVVDSYNLELSDSSGFIGDRASKGAFRSYLDEERKLFAKSGEDPLGEEDSASLSKKAIDQHLIEDVEAAGIVFSAIERFSNELAGIIQRFLKVKEWKGTQRIVVGGGFRNSRAGEIAIGRASALLKRAGIDVKLCPIRHHPDEAGLLGAGHLAPAWMFAGHRALLAVDIGGTNIRVGLVRLRLKEASDLSRAEVVASDLWRHRDEKPSREEAVAKLISMLAGMIDKAEAEDLALAPFIGIGCPGVIDADGSIERGSQNLPGNWASSRFHLPTAIAEGIPTIAGCETMILMHNDAVVQGLSEVPFMTDVERWGVLTVGTGLGNARFTNRG
ncbi:ROK family protein [Terrihabitans rhizophilus]|uniref:ROK family protein n=1 Tax=Terrihabitans rhizophilus TaxID=3092662 RepID=A0ABU4RRV5_9HYPH|nr:ROK family protein [Terrihabitans sp. PJ23]MDX6807590.1 ROK family protein [Terrihabitans sp. PJ23]